MALIRVLWQGYDFGGSGIQCYNVQFKDGSDPWVDSSISPSPNFISKAAAAFGEGGGEQIRAKAAAGSTEGAGARPSPSLARPTL